MENPNSLGTFRRNLYSQSSSYKFHLNMCHFKISILTMLDSTFFLSFLVHLSCLSLSSLFFPSIYISFCTSFLYMSFPLLVSCNLYSSIRSSRNKQKRVQSWWPTSSLLFSSYICRFQNDGNNHQETQEIEGKADLVSIPSTNLNPKTHDPLLDSLQC